MLPINIADFFFIQKLWEDLFIGTFKNNSEL